MSEGYCYDLDQLRRKNTLTEAEASAYVNARDIRQFRREVKRGDWPNPIVNSRPPRYSRVQFDKFLAGEPEATVSVDHASFEAAALAAIDD